MATRPCSLPTLIISPNRELNSIMPIAIIQFVIRAGLHFYGTETRNHRGLDNRITLIVFSEDKSYNATAFPEKWLLHHEYRKNLHGNGERNDPLAWDEEYKFKATELGKMGEGRNMTGGVLKWCNWLSAEGSRRRPGRWTKRTKSSGVY